MPIDQIERKILKEYLMNAKLSSHEIARKIGASVGTVLSRTRRMEKEGIIKGYSAVLDHTKLGYELTVVIEIIVSKGKVIEIGEEIAKLPQVCALYNVTGRTDAIMIAKFKTRKELSGFTKNLLKMPNVVRTYTHVVLEATKEDFNSIGAQDSL